MWSGSSIVQIGDRVNGKSLMFWGMSRRYGREGQVLLRYRNKWRVRFTLGAGFSYSRELWLNIVKVHAKMRLRNAYTQRKFQFAPQSETHPQMEQMELN